MKSHRVKFMALPTILGALAVISVLTYQTQAQNNNLRERILEFEIGDNDEANNQSAVTDDVRRFLVARPIGLTSQMVVNENGDVGIGNITPRSKLDVVGMVSSTDHLNRSMMVLSDGSTPNLMYLRSPQDFVMQIAVNNNRDLRFGQATGTGDTFNDFMTIQSASGRVGIGNTTPRSKLDVNGMVSSSDHLNKSMMVLTDGSTPNLMYFRSPQDFVMQIAVNNNRDLRFGQATGTGDTFNDFMTIQSASGRVGVGTTTPTQKLHVVGSVLADAYLTTSSKRWKTNIKTIENAVEIVQQLRGVHYDRKTDGKHDIGLIAEEVGEVIPEVVTYEENGVDAQSVAYARLVALLIEATKEQQQIIDAQNSSMTAMEKTIQELENVQSDLSMVKAENATIKKTMAKFESDLQKLSALATSFETMNSPATGE